MKKPTIGSCWRILTGNREVNLESPNYTALDGSKQFTRGNVLDEVVIVFVTIAQALPKGDKLDEIVRACTEIGVAHFKLFASDRTVVRWDPKKTAERVRRLEVIAREASEMSFRTRLPTFEVEKNLESVLKKQPDALVLSEVEELSRKLPTSPESICLVVGPEGGWSSRELGLIGDRGVTLGPRVLRVDHAAAAAAAMLLLAH